MFNYMVIICFIFNMNTNYSYNSVNYSYNSKNNSYNFGRNL